MTLEILISQYNETEEVIKPLLDSIAIQQGIDLNDINVIIANDGTNVILSDEFLESYPFHIDYYLKEHEGMSGNRNFLLDRAKADYIMFCDADDMFVYSLGLYLIFSCIQQGEFDLFHSDFIAEKRDSNNKSIYSTMKAQPHVHGKVVRRQYVIDQNIRWKQELPIHDCRYFFALCEKCTTKDRIKYCDQPFYLWKWNKNSVTKHTDNAFLKTYSYFTLSMAYLVEELINRKLLQAAAGSAFSYLYFTYFLYNSEIWVREENQKYVEKALRSYSIFYSKYSSLVELLDESQKNDIIKQQRNNIAKNQDSIYIETITFSNFIEKIKMISQEND